MSKVTFDNSQSTFFKALKEKVDNYFAENQLSPSGGWRLYFKGIFQVVTALSLYGILVFFTPVTWLAIVLTILLGINMALIGFNIMHEGGHQSFSRFGWINKLSVYSLNFLGGHSDYWKIKHNINHHTFTNIEGLDSDIDVLPFMRLHEEQPRYWFHRFQHIYWVILYGLSYLSWIFYDDFKKYFSGKVTLDMKPKKWNLKEHLVFWATKVMYIGVFIILPVVMVGWLKALVGFVIVAFVTGLFISIVFQLAHVVEGTQFITPHDSTTKIDHEWAIHQISTTANFATKNKFLYWLLGGLNFQIEHHLFPRISHIHYPQVSKFVKEVCKEYNITYIEYTSMFRAFYSHLVHLKHLGTA